METSQQQNTNNSTEFPCYETLDPVEFINKTYKKNSLLDLQDALIDFSKRKNLTKTQIDRIIPKNFAKFIACKGLIEKIKQDYKNKHLLETNSDKEIALIVKKFENLISKHNIQLEEKHEKEYSNLFLYPIKEAKDMLRFNILNIDVFVSNLKSQEDMIIKYGKRFKTELLSEIKPEIKEFLDYIYDKILVKKYGFEEVCRLIDIYLYVLNFGEEINITGEKSKLINTMLVRFKSETLNNMKLNDEYYSYLFRSLMTILDHTDEIQGIEAIHHVFACFKNVLSSADPKYSKIVLRRIDNFRKSFKGPSYCIKEIKNELSFLRVELFKHFIHSMTIAESINLFDSFIGIFREVEIKKAQEILSTKTARYLINSELKKFEYLEENDRILKIVKNCLGSEEGKIVKSLERTLRDKKNQEIQEISKEFSSLFNKQNDDVKILMEALKIVEGGKDNAFKVFFENKDKISSRPVILFYLHRYLKVSSPILSTAEKERAAQLKYQFGILNE